MFFMCFVEENVIFGRNKNLILNIKFIRRFQQQEFDEKRILYCIIKSPFSQI